ncbi:glutamate racemase [Aquabacter spiritensis]|uniref:Glutamate racemase n=1 Tax=Aquabacter spiritensis TaxID=933073 RepID=A0A4R3LK59_9HYPH|nr:glutamate racemase [Aquabacter spiritensis]TCT00231.1 glutamate racemase [Aquabacter spiritensis]
MAIVTASAGSCAVVPTTHLRSPTILVFDSGLGGLSVFTEIARLRPDAHYVYAADTAAFPYGAMGEAALTARVGEVMDDLVPLVRPDLVVIACNTASTLALPSLRARYAVPFVGTVPAIKPACAGSVSKRISVLATPGTVRRDYTASLIREFAGACQVVLVPSDTLAGLAESVLAGIPVDDADLRREILPCFVRDAGGRTDTIVLACTHYPLILGHLTRLAPWPVSWIDPAPAIARRVVSLLGPAAGAGSPKPLHLVATGAPLDSELVSAVTGRRVAASAQIEPARRVAS